jgi:DNA-directed RNA polymerase subunit beta'
MEEPQMSRLDPKEGFEALKSKVTEAVQSVFPIEGSKHTLRLNGLEIKDNKDIEDIRSQKEARLSGTTWAVPVNADLSLIDTKTGKEVDRRKMRIINLPKVTGRYSYLVDGHEYQLDNQWQLKPGVYSRVNQQGELGSEFHLKGRSRFNVLFDQAAGQFKIKKGDTHIPLYPILKELGVPDDELERQWGKPILASNRQEGTQKALEQFYRATMGRKPESPQDAKNFIHQFMDQAEMDPNVSRLTLGKPLKTAGGEAITLATKKLLDISRGQAPQDNRDSLMFKRFRSAEDYVAEAIRERSDEILRRVGNNLNRRTKVNEIVSPDIFNRPIHTVFTKTALSNSPEQMNPLEMVSGAMKTTIMGEGGIKSEHKVTPEAKLVDPSHLGFLDPIHTPEGSRSGITLQLPLGATKKGDKVVVRMWNTKTGKMEDVDPERAYHSNVVLPDQVRWENGKPIPLKSKIKLSTIGNEIIEGQMRHADYVMTSPVQMFSLSTNLVPFLQNDSGNRATYAGRQMEQAIPLTHREVPLVQTLLSARKGATLNELIGRSSSHLAPVSGEVLKVGKDHIHIQGDDGKKHEMQLYEHFPLNDEKSFMHSAPLVKPGDRVRENQVVADTNFTRNGSLALGTNLRAGFVPFHGYNFEDGVVISDSASRKLTSEHMYRKGLDLSPDHVQDRKKFASYFGSTITKGHMDKLDEDGVIKPGTEIKPGDLLVAALKKKDITDDESRMLSRMHKSLVQPYSDASIRWEADHPGIVTNIVKHGGRVEVHVRTNEAAEIGDKITGRHGNKGIITRIVPDHEMPKTSDGRHIDIALNPAGIPGRLNLGQVLETAAAKIAEKTGKPYQIQNFDGTEDWLDRVQKDLKAHGLSDKELLFDPTSGKPMGEALVGPHYIHKLKHQVEKKLVARAGGPGYSYDVNHIPKGGGPHGAQAIDALGLYAMLAHGAKANIREMQTYKSNAETNDELWSAIQAGDPIPPPKPSFAYNKFLGYLKAIGVNAVKQGNTINLMPLTDKNVLEMSNGAIKDPGRMVIGKNLKPEEHGLFDPKVTGGVDGTKWAHIKLPEPMPNPIFEKAITSLTGLKQKDFDAVMSGEKAIHPKTGAFVKPEEGLRSGLAISHLLGKIDVQKELRAAQARLADPALKGPKLDATNKKVKYLSVLSNLGMTPHEAYMQQHIPVIPPALRPVSVMPNGSLNEDDLNHMYKGVGLLVKKMNEASPLLPDHMKDDRRSAIYDGMRSLAGLGGHLNQKFRGVLDIIRGKRVKEGEKEGKPKEGFFQEKLIKRKQDLSMRSTIIPEPELGLDQVGIPRTAAMEIYKPFVVRELRGLADMTPLQAQLAIKNNDPLASRALERVVDNRPLLMKRDPVLHRYGVQAFKPVLISGKAIKIHPLVTSGYNADFDGDTMSAFVPLTTQAVKEAYDMLPSRNLFSPASGSIMYRPTHESQLGLFTLAQVTGRSNESFKDLATAAQAAHQGKINFNHEVKIGQGRTTVGRALIAEVLPEPLRKKVLDPTFVLDGKGQAALLTVVAKEHKNDFGVVSNKLKDLGNQFATNKALSLGLDDLRADKVTRDKILRMADAKVAEIMKGPGKQVDKEKKVVQVYDGATQAMLHVVDTQHSKKPTALFNMMKAGVKPSIDAYRQITMAPMLIMNAKGEVIPSPVRKSYSEGLDTGDYWTSMSGARKGVIQKVQSVEEPGYLTKQVMNSVINNIVGVHDCGTKKGISLPVEEKDILDRHLAVDVKIGKKTFPAGTLITPEVRDSLRNNKARIGKIIVRSPLRCEHGTGICAKCYGLDENGQHPAIGKNVGVISAQSIGERATQLSMRTFHEGGIAPVGEAAKARAQLTDQFNRVKQLVQLYEKIPKSATLSTMEGKVTKISKDPAGGTNVFVEGVRHYVPQDRGEPIVFVGDKPKKLSVGMAVQKGDPVSHGPINPHELLPLAGLSKVQGYLSSQLYDLYKSEGIRRRNIETIVKSMTNLTRVEEPGDNKEFLRGDFAPTSQIQAVNKRLNAERLRPIQHAPVLKGVQKLPLDIQTDWMARLNHERLHETIIEAANKGWGTNIHGTHPIPGIAHGAEFGLKHPH